MRCPKCGYHSFETLDDCKKCGHDLQEHKGKFRIGGAIVAPLLAMTRGAQPSADEPAAEPEAPPAAPAETAAPEGDVDFGFGLMDDEPPAETEAATPVASDPETEPDLEEAFSFSDEADADDAPFAVQEDIPDLSEIDDADDLFESVTDDSVDFDGAVVEPTFDAVAAEAAPEPVEEPIADPPASGVAADADEGFDEDDLDGINLDDLVSFDDEPPTAAPSVKLEDPPAETAIEDDSEPDIDFDVEPEAEPDPEPVAEMEAGSGAEAEIDPYDGITEIEEDESEEAEADAAQAADDEEDLFAFDDAGWRKGRNDQTLNAQALAEAETTSSETLAGSGLLALDAGSNGVAGLGARIAATAFDLALLVLLGAAFLMAGEMAMGKESLLPPIDALLTLGVYYYLVLFAWFFGYFTLFHFLSGETPGKMLFRIRVETVEGQGLSFSQAFLRSIGGLISLILIGLGYLMIVIDRHRRGWNDRLAGTHVVFSRSEPGDTLEMA